MISIVIPLFNKYVSISKTIDCVLAQTYPHFELIVVNDGSTDGSDEVVKSYNDSRIKLISKPNGGVSSARNRGIKESKYDYIALLDADDYWMPSYLEEQVKMIEDFPNAWMWGMGWGYQSKEFFTKITHFVNQPNFRGYVHGFWTMPKKSQIFCASSVVIRKTAFDGVGLFDERLKYSEDLDMWWRIILKYPVAFNGNILAYYRQDAENRAMNRPIPFDKFLPFYIEKYSDSRLNNDDFRKFFDRFCIGGVYPYLLGGKYKSDVKRVLSYINLSEQKFSVRFSVMFPKIFKFACKILYCEK